MQQEGFEFMAKPKMTKRPGATVRTSDGGHETHVVEVGNVYRENEAFSRNRVRELQVVSVEWEGFVFVRKIEV